LPPIHQHNIPHTPSSKINNKPFTNMSDLNDVPPAGPPPSYQAATGQPSNASNTIDPRTRRSMEDEARPLPPGWIRQFDKESKHQFFVDSTKEPPRRIWHHPYDDEEYLSTLAPEDSRKITRKVLTNSGLNDNEITKIEKQDQPKGLSKFGRHIKDRLTHSTHEEREAARQKQAEEDAILEARRREEEKKAYVQHLAYRKAFSRAQETGQPQLLGKDSQGRDVYIEPPYGPAVPQGAVGYNPYANGPYTNPNARFLRPEDPYYRPYGYGYGSGLGFPLLGGIGGGLLLGSLLF
jgi:hypothetical protein